MIFLAKLFVITFALALVQSNDYGDELFFLHKSTEGDEALLVVTWEESEDEIYTECDFYSDENQISEVLESSNDPPVEAISEDEMQKFLEECDTVNGIDELRAEEDREVRKATTTRSSATTTTTDSDATTPGYDGIPIIFPGTKWCGAGNIAKNYDDLGCYQDTDRCCRAHDMCNDTLAPGETRNKLTNKSPFTKLSCKCDNDFYKCLDRVSSVTSNTIGNMYFNVLKRECYEEDYPPTKKCKKYRILLKHKCLEYEKDTKAGKVYQWVRAKKYKKIPFPGPLTVTLLF